MVPRTIRVCKSRMQVCKATVYMLCIMLVGLALRIPMHQYDIALYVMSEGYSLQTSTLTITF